jgi:radical SAM superfamily enzyme YgiQ (UPF0313 family)
MRVLLIYFNTAARASFPLGLTSLSNYIVQKGHAVEIFDTTFYKEFAANKRDNVREKLGYYKKIENVPKIEYLESSLKGDLMEKIEEFQPNIVGLSILSAHFHYSMTISRFIKRHFPSIPVIVGGLHPTLAPDETIKEPSVDMICLGEGEYPFAELLEKMEHGKDITSIKGIWFKEGEEVFKTEMGVTTDLNDLPITNWDLFSEQHIMSPLDGRMYRIGPVEFSRGCPYSCAYCAINFLRDMFPGQTYLRRKEVSKSIEELVHLKEKYKLEMFYFLDESFLSTDTKSLRTFAEEYRRQVDLPFYGMTHPLSVTEEKVKLLKKMGCYLMTIGIEHGNEQFRKQVLNRKGSNRAIIRAFETFRKYGIHASAFGMLGLPYETRELVFETVDLFRKCKPRTYAVGIFKPYLGSRLRDLSIKEGFFDPANDDYIYPDITSLLNMPQFPKEEIEKLYRAFYLYTKVPRDKFPLVQQAETDDNVLAKLVSEYR